MNNSLEILVNELYEHRKMRGTPVCADPIAFAVGLHRISDGYSERLDVASGVSGQKKKYCNVKKAAERLREALSALSVDEQQELYFSHYGQCENMQNTFREENDLPFNIGELDGDAAPLAPAAMLHQLRGFIDATEELSSSASKGRQPNYAERWAAREFIVLCHQSGWSPIQVANSPSKNCLCYEKQGQSGLQHSDAVICLAATFVEAGLPKNRAESRAHTALRVYRDINFIHVVPYGIPECDYDEKHYEVTLSEMVCLEEQEFIEAMRVFSSACRVHR